MFEQRAAPGHGQVLKRPGTRRGTLLGEAQWWVRMYREGRGVKEDGG